jgi:hypothetical protein
MDDERVETREAVLMCVGCGHPGWHRYWMSVQRAEEDIGEYVAHWFLCVTCGCRRVWGISGLVGEVAEESA